CFLDHLRQRLHDLFFRVIDVAQRVHEQIIHGLDVFRKEAHAFLLVFWVSVFWVSRLSGCDSTRRAWRHHVLNRKRAKGRPVPTRSIIDRAMECSRCWNRSWNLQLELTGPGAIVPLRDLQLTCTNRARLDPGQPRHWQERAEEARSIADQLEDPESRRMMLRIADDYERLAAHARARVRPRAAQS